ncbi:hypothetical protein BDZ94DRAFT_1256497 [Collybia nuda]|uniref:Uncharacterized protein n=1 Tax=Collybia nuda TaxID=64659 RepID=A0A9P5Y858_9AGAR|nr:hypothetical protein BDZ94DRAFT_1256497 [Collybia nuda]
MLATCSNKSISTTINSEYTAKQASIQHLLNEITETIKIKREMYQICKDGKMQNLTQFYTLGESLTQKCDSLVMLSPHETMHSHMKQIDEQRESISGYFTAITQWMQDIEPLIPQYMTCDPIKDLLTRVKNLSEYKELKKRQLGLHREPLDLPNSVPLLNSDELEEGEIREGPQPRKNLTELLQHIKQFHASYKHPPHNSPPNNINAIVTSEHVKQIIQMETNSILNASLIMLLLTIGNLGDTYVVKMWDLLKETWTAIHVIDEHLGESSTHAVLDQSPVASRS